MRQIVNVVSGILFGLAPLVGSAIIGLVLYDSYPGTIAVIIDVLIGIGAIWIGLDIFKKVKAVGPIEFMSNINSSPELDHLQPEPNSETKRRQPLELVQLMAKKEHLFKGGSMRIYGDWFGEPYSSSHEFEQAQFDKTLNLLTLAFKNGEKLEIHHPTGIFEASTFLKVLDASRIKKTWPSDEKADKHQGSYYLDYKKESKTINTDTNVERKHHTFNVSLGEPALMIFGKVTADPREKEASTEN